MIKKVIYNLIANTASITSRLARYELQGGAIDRPAIFTGRSIPDDSAYPAIIIRHAGGDRFGCRDSRGADENVNVFVYDDKEQSSKALDDLAHLIWRALDRADLAALLAAEGYECWGCRANPPSIADDESGYPGYMIQVFVRALETSV